MEHRISAADWKSTEMIRAETDLFDAIDQAGKEIAEADRRLAENTEQANGIDALKEWATGPDAPPVLQAALDDVETGVRTRDEALADPEITADPVVMAALEAMTRTPPRRRTPRVGYDPEDFSTHDVMRNM